MPNSLVTIAMLDVHRSTAWTAASYTNAQKQQALDTANGWATSELTGKGYGSYTTASGDWDTIKSAICDYALDILKAGRETSLKRSAQQLMKSIKMGRQNSNNRIRDNGRSFFGKGSADGRTKPGSARGATF